jgi:catechol 2,3-dioxygenase-like lactoylglutathione lyase family enzyme
MKSGGDIFVLNLWMLGGRIDFMGFRVSSISAMVPSTDLERSVGFLVNALGFALVFSSETYRILVRDGFEFHLQQAGEGGGPIAIYIQVDDVESVWVGLQGYLEGVRHKAPFDQEYQMREVHVDLPCTQALLFIGQAIDE